MGAMAFIYNASDLIDNLHEVPHIDFNLHRVHDTSGDFDSLGSHNYRQSIGMLVSLPVVIGLIACVIAQITLFCGCCKYNGCLVDRFKPASYRYIRMSLAAIGVIILIFSSLSIVANENVHEMATSFIERSQGLEATYNIMNESTYNISITANATHRLTHQLHIDLQALPKGEVPDSVMTAQGQIGTEMGSMAAPMGVMRDQAPDMDFSKAYRDVRSTSHYHWLCAAMLLSFVMAFAVLIIVNALLDYSILHLTTIVVGMLLLVLGSVACGVHFGGAVADADICIDPDTFVFYQLGSNANLVPYLNCQNPTDSPFPDEMTFARFLINNSLADVPVLNAFAANFTEFKPLIHEIAANLHSMSHNMNKLSVGLECKKPHQSYQLVLQVACLQLSTGLVQLMTCESVTMVLTFLALILSVLGWKYHCMQQPMHSARLSCRNTAADSATERTPLLKSLDDERDEGYDANSGRGEGVSVNRHTGAAAAVLAVSSADDGCYDFTDLAVHVESELVCKICLARKINVALVPCGHTVCLMCGEKLLKCPFCRRPVKERTSIFLS